jgi:hypothetical protein
MLRTTLSYQCFCSNSRVCKPHGIFVKIYVMTFLAKYTLLHSLFNFEEIKCNNIIANSFELVLYMWYMIYGSYSFECIEL